MIEIVMFLSGWWYFSKLKKRIDDLEDEVMMLKRDAGKVYGFVRRSGLYDDFPPFLNGDKEKS
jgi:hypothetical protein